MFRIREHLFPTLAACAFLGVLVVFAVQIFSFRGEVEFWARRDLRAQARLAAENLDEALRTQDFRRIRAFSDELAAQETGLEIHSVRGGSVFASDMPGSALAETVRTGDYLISVKVPSRRVERPFVRALVGFALAALVGFLAMLFIFLTLYRQRMRIRELNRLEKFRREFVADVSHEIKTPLTGILGAADLMEGDSPLVQMIKKEATRLNALVQQILDLARLEKGETILNGTTVDLGELCREVATRYAVSVRLPREPLVIRADAQLLEEALVNLVENAQRHSGSTEIEVSCARMANGVELAVSDRGVGISPEQSARIFERFYRVDPARAAETGGAGLGLAIVRRIARLHGGDAFYQSIAPHGSRFVLRFGRCSPVGD